MSREAYIRTRIQFYRGSVRSCLCRTRIEVRQTDKQTHMVCRVAGRGPRDMIRIRKISDGVR